MKIIPLLILALAATACTANDSRLVVAYRLYTSCVHGTINVALPVKNQAEFDNLISYTDDWCTMWTDTWYSSFVAEDDELTLQERIRFINFREEIKDVLKKDYRTLSNADKK